MEKRGGGSILTLTYLGSQRVFTNYNVMGVAKAALEASVRYLASDLGPQNIRVNAISAGPIKTLAAAGISGFSSILQVYRERAPLRRNVDTAEVADAAVFLLEPRSRAHHRRNADGRRRLPRRRACSQLLELTPFFDSDAAARGMPSSSSSLGISSTSAGGPQTKQSVAGSWTSGADRRGRSVRVRRSSRRRRSRVTVCRSSIRPSRASARSSSS